MSRLVKHSAQAPTQVETDGSPIYVCRCGLTKNSQGLCDGSHETTKDEEKSKMYVYDKNNKKEEVGCKGKGCNCC